MRNILTCDFNMPMAKTKENINLSFSNKDLQTFLYILLVKWSFKFPSLCSSTVDFSLLLIDCTYKLMNQTKEYWYIGSIFASSEMQKNSTEECFDTGMYWLRALSISFSVTAAIFCFSWISSERTLLDVRILLAVSSSKMLPSDDERTWKKKITLMKSIFLKSKQVFHSWQKYKYDI